MHKYFTLAIFKTILWQNLGISLLKFYEKKTLYKERIREDFTFELLIHFMSLKIIIVTTVLEYQLKYSQNARKKIFISQIIYSNGYETEYLNRITFQQQSK